MRIASLVMLVCCLASCGAGSSGSVGDALRPSASEDMLEVKTYYASGALESVGSQTADGKRHGEWRWYFEENGQVSLRMHFQYGVPDESAVWELFNKHGSLRANYLDGAYIFERLWE